MAIEHFCTFEGTPVNGYVCQGVPDPDGGYGWDVVYYDDPDPVRADWARRMWLRQWRDYRLLETDWVELAAPKMKENELEAWRAYRQQLRDLPECNCCDDPACGCSATVECPCPPCFDDGVDTHYIPWRINNPPPRPEGWVNPRLADVEDNSPLVTPHHDFHDHEGFT